MNEIQEPLKGEEARLGTMALCRSDLKFLCRDILGFSDWDECHDDLQEWIYQHRDRRFKLFLMPRGFLKTSIITIGKTIQDILNNFDTRILLSSAVWNNARSFLREISDLHNGYFTRKSILPDLFGSFISDKWNQEEIIIRQRQKPSKTPTIDTAGIDKVLTSQHYDRIRADDLVTRETVTTEEQIKKVVNHIKDLHKLLEPDGEMDLIGTRWDDQDAYDWVLKDLTKKDMGGEAFAVYQVPPAKNKSGEFVYIDGMKYPPESIPIFPKKFSIEALESLRFVLGAYDYSCNIENNPTSPTNRIFNPPFRYFDSMPEEVAHVITVDPAISEKKESCDAVVIDSAMSKSGQLFVAAYVAFKEKEKHPKNLIEQIIDYHLLFGTRVVGIESNGYQEVICLLLEDELAKRKIIMDIVPIKNDDDKARRIICLQPIYERGDLLIKRGMVELEEQLEKFRKPITAKCDILDALSSRAKIPEEFIVYGRKKGADNLVMSHPSMREGIEVLNRMRVKRKNPYEGIALPESEWAKRQRLVA